jgi:hypothetical protein
VQVVEVDWVILDVLRRFDKVADYHRVEGNLNA